ncbi:MAG TPA: PilZ domain-containing protein [Tepidisphaeraceae bacterium]|jgi:hypothetical protein
MTLTCDRPTVSQSTDRRRDERFDDRRLVQLFEPFSGQFFAGLTCNVSSAGICVRLPAEINLRAGRFVTVHGAGDVGPRGGRQGPITARVVWAMTDAQDEDVVLVGLELYAAAISAAA